MTVQCRPTCLIRLRQEQTNAWMTRFRFRRRDLLFQAPQNPTLRRAGFFSLTRRGRASTCVGFMIAMPQICLPFTVGHGGWTLYEHV